MAAIATFKTNNKKSKPETGKAVGTLRVRVTQSLECEIGKEGFWTKPAVEVPTQW